MKENIKFVKAGKIRAQVTNKEKIISTVQNLLDDNNAYEKMSKAVNPYGDGKACEYIEKIILDYFNK